ncbi:MAG: hypothetical protein IPP34_02420 [Bacteroidetes bacterium]|nr:hypothetical protein [Bacteroidota bacterium]
MMLRIVYAFAKILVLLFLVSNGLSAFAQEEQSIRMEQALENNAGEGESEIDLSELTEVLEFFKEHPLNINKSDANELYDSKLFTPLQISSLIFHRQRFGDFLAIQELQVVPGFDETILRELEPYLTTGKFFDDPNADFGRMIREGKHQLISRVQFVLQEKNGYIDDGSRPYLGSPLAIYTRYRFAFMKKISWGFTADKDAGEQFFKGNQKRRGFNFYTAHFAIRNVGPFALIAIGDYQVGYGQGLTLSSGLSGGKPADPVQIRRDGFGIKPYTSSNEAFFKRGIALSVKKRSFTTDAFISYRKVDANISQAADTSDAESYFTSLQESGYHRTENEFADRKAIAELFYGGHIGYRKRHVSLGLTMVNTVFTEQFNKEVKPYNQFDFRGKSLLNAGFDYAWLFRNISFFGEVAGSPNGSIAFLNGFTMGLHPTMAISILHRQYPRNFQSLTSGAFKESGNNANEQGFYAGISVKPVKTISVLCSYDRFYFPWLRYRTDGPSGGEEFSGTITYSPSRKTSLYVRGRYSQKMLNLPEEFVLINSISEVTQKGLRFHLTTKISSSFTIRSRVEVVSYKYAGESEQGFAVMQDVQFHPMSFPLSFNFRYAMFDTESYDSRIYSYENDVLYGYSIPAYYYRGSRFYFNTRIKIRKGFDCWLRYSISAYSNREVIGSGYEEIEGNKKEEVKIQIRFEW